MQLGGSLGVALDAQVSADGSGLDIALDTQLGIDDLFDEVVESGVWIKFGVDPFDFLPVLPDLGNIFGRE